MNIAWDLARPALLALLALVPLYAWLRHRLRARRVLAFAPLQHSPAPSRAKVPASLGTVVLVLECLALALVLFALAGPHRRTELELLEDEGVDVGLVLDVSLSMLAEDFEPNRLEALRRITGEFIDRSAGNRLALYVFAKDAYVQSPLTTDRVALGSLLESVTVYTLNQSLSGGTAIGDALLVAGTSLAENRLPNRDQAVILITDGESNLGIDPVLAARYLQEEGFRFYAIGIGGEQPVQVFFEGRPVGDPKRPYQAALDDTQLRAMAEASGGRFWRATDVGALEAVFAELSRLERAPLESRTLVRRRFLSAELGLLAAAVFVAALLLGARERRPLG